MTLTATHLHTPIGQLALLADDDVIVAAGFASADVMAARLPGSPPFDLRPTIGRLSAAVAAYFIGDVTAIDDLAVAQPGGAFHQAAWKVMREVPPGQTITYAELAERAGNGAAVRAAGSACARNLIAPIIPCHRIVRTGGGLGGYYYDLPAKEWLLAHEKRVVSG